MYTTYSMPHRYAKLSFKGHLMIAIICLLIASTFGS